MRGEVFVCHCRSKRLWLRQDVVITSSEVFVSSVSFHHKKITRKILWTLLKSNVLRHWFSYNSGENVDKILYNTGYLVKLKYKL